MRGGMPEQFGGAAAKQAILAKLSLMPPAVRERFQECYEDGRRRGAVRSAEPVAERISLDGVPPNELVARRQAETRQKALLSCIPPARTDLLQKGLRALDAADQHPDEILAWLNDPDARTLILAGPTGNGKTEAGYAAQVHAATVGAAMTDRRGRVSTRSLLCRAVDVNSYLAALRPDGGADPAWTLRDRVYTCDLLLGDDLGAELDNEEMKAFVRDELARLQTWRLEHNLRTIWTTNRRGHELRTMVGGRMWSRMHERSVAITFTGPDRRKLSKLDW
jgi:hypothetical protein